MTHGAFTARIVVISLAAGFVMLALAAGIPMWLVFAGAGYWVAASFLGVLIAKVIAFGSGAGSGIEVSNEVAHGCASSPHPRSFRCRSEFPSRAE